MKTARLDSDYIGIERERRTELASECKEYMQICIEWHTVYPKLHGNKWVSVDVRRASPKSIVQLLVIAKFNTSGSL